MRPSANLQEGRCDSLERRKRGTPSLMQKRRREKNKEPTLTVENVSGTVEGGGETQQAHQTMGGSAAAVARHSESVRC